MWNVFNKNNTWQQTTFDQKSSPGLFWIRLNDDTFKILNLGVIKNHKSCVLKSFINILLECTLRLHTDCTMVSL